MEIYIYKGKEVTEIAKCQTKIQELPCPIFAGQDEEEIVLDELTINLN